MNNQSDANFVYASPPCGAVKGRAERGMKVFLGIPYARADRFCLPERARWEGTFDATRFGECCPQKRAYADESVYSPFYYREFREGVGFRYGEDCLVLNVYAPARGENLPVVLFVHGGSFFKGSADERPFDGEEYCKRGVILVTMNYRLGAFGMLSDDSVPFNLALHDQFSALEWVHDNIAAFGGNPDNVTFAGQSAGAISVQIHALRRETAKYAARVVMMSGGGFLGGLFAPHDQKYAVRFAKKVVAAAGVKDFDGLRKLDVEDLFKAWQRAFDGSLTAQIAVLPCMDGVLASRENYDRFDDERQLPALFGVTGKDIAPAIMRRAVKKYAERSSADCYGYIFDLPLAGGGKKGAWHSCDLWFAFGTLSRSWRPFAAEDYEASRRLADAVCSFASRGVPASDGRAWVKLPEKFEVFSPPRR